MKKYTILPALALALTVAVTGCGTATNTTSVPAEESAFATESVQEAVREAPAEEAPAEEAPVEEAPAEEAPAEEASTVEAEEAPAEEPSAEPQIVSVANVTSDGILDATDFFTERDLTQTADRSGAETFTVSDGEDIHITAEGVYVLTGSASNVTVYVEADDAAKVQLVLDGVSITNEDFPCIYVTGADKVFVTTAADSSLSVTGTFTADGETNTDGAIFAKSDLILNGTAALTIDSTDNGVVCKDDLKITGGTYNITATSKTIEANDSIRISDGTLNLTAGTDGLHAENSDDDSLGYIYICGGTLNLSVGDDGIHGVSVVQIDGGEITIDAAEGIEATYIQINDGTITINASDDGINGAYKSTAYTPTLEFNGGVTTVVMGAGDTDGIDCNGDLTINGGTIDVTGNSAFDYDGAGTFNGGTIIVNGQQVDSIPNQMMGGRGMW